MDKKKKFFPGQEEDEKISLLIRKHWFNYIIFFVLGGLGILPVVALVIFLAVAKPELSAEIYASIIMFSSIFMLFILGVLLYGFVDYYLDIYIITDKRIVDINQNGLFKRSISEVHLRQVQDVSAHVNGFFQTMLHFGDVLIQTAGETPNFTFESIPHPYLVSKKIIDLHEEQLGRKTKSTSCKPPSRNEDKTVADAESAQTGTPAEFPAEPVISKIQIGNDGELTEGREVQFK